MLKKLLKYDLKSVFKYWWIAAVATFGISFFGGFAVRVLRYVESQEYSKAVPIVLNMVATMTLPVIYLAFAALAILTLVLVYTRYYKNFFSDEGYLTFTLPVKKSELINSKIIMSAVSSLATFLVVAVDALIILCIGFFDEIIKPVFWKDFFAFFSEIYKVLGGYTFVYALELIVILFMIVLFSNLFICDSIAVSCMLAKKARVITAVGVYYVANGALSAIYTIFTVFGLNTIIDIMSSMKNDTLLPLIAWLGLGLIVMVVMLTSLLYILQYWIIDRKLNLS